MSGLSASLAWQPVDLGWAIDRLTGGNPGPATGDRSNRGAGTIEEALVTALSGSRGEPVPLSSRIEGAARCIAYSAPMVVPLADGETAALVVRANRRSATLLAHDGTYQNIRMAELLAELEAPLPAEIGTTIGRLEREVNPAVAGAVRREHLSHHTIFAGWQIPDRPSTGPAFWDRSTIAGVVGLLGVHALHFGLWILSWSLLVGALLGVGDREPTLMLWMVALISSLLLLPLESLLQQSLATRLGVVIKKSLLANALTLDKSAVRELGIGQLTARALEADRLEVLATQGGLRMLLCAFDAVGLIAVFVWLAGLQPLLALFILAILLSAQRWHAYYCAEERLLAAHLRLTAVHTEEMIGHRARKAFVGRSEWHAQEESCLAAYEQACAEADRIELGAGIVPRLWAVGGVAIILLELFGQSTATLASIALIGFVIVGFGVLHSASNSILKLLRALVSSKYVPVGHTDDSIDASQAEARQDAGDGSRLIVQGLGYAYPDSARQVLRDVDLGLEPGAKILLTGDSGSGKSTLGALLAGRLQPTFGSILSQGMDRHVVGRKGWLKQVCYVPQPGSNHVLTDTFAFNLLLGRAWPPSAADLEEAGQVAHRLGLGPLIERMPAGMMQMVGEGGWRLSQGEQARLFLARGILQGARVLVVDELLAPLDPITSLEVLKAVEELPSQLILVAHT